MSFFCTASHSQLGLQLARSVFHELHNLGDHCRPSMKGARYQAERLRAYKPGRVAPIPDLCGLHSQVLPDCSASAALSAQHYSLCAGRMLIGQGAIDACKIGVTIATRYACARPQFGSQFIMGYLTHQRRLLPALACAYGLHLTMLRLKVRRL